MNEVLKNNQNPFPDIPYNTTIKFVLKNPYWRVGCAKDLNVVYGQYGWNPIPYLYGEWGIRTIDRNWVSHKEILSWENY